MTGLYGGYYAITGVAAELLQRLRVARPTPATALVTASVQLTAPQSVVFTVGQVVAAAPIYVQPTSLILPLSYFLASPFGTSNPDVSTAEVTGLYNIVLGRAPDAAGLDGWVSLIKSGTYTFPQVASFFLHSTAYESIAVASYYVNFLGRTAAPSEVAGWVDYMQHGHTEEEVAQLFLSNPAYAALHPTNADFVLSLYNNLLASQGTPADVANWVALLSGGLAPGDPLVVQWRLHRRVGRPERRRRLLRDLLRPRARTRGPEVLRHRPPARGDPGRHRRGLRRLGRIHPARQRDRHVRR